MTALENTGPKSRSSASSPSIRVYSPVDPRALQDRGHPRWPENQLRPAGDRDLDQRHRHARRWPWSRPPKILRKHLNAFVQYFEPGESIDAEPNVAAAVAAPAMNEELQAKLNGAIGTLELSVRASNCLESAKIHTVGELVKLSENDLLKVRSFGKTSLREVKRKLQDIGLSLGMTLDAARPQPPRTRRQA